MGRAIKIITRLYHKVNKELSEEEIKKLEKTCIICGKIHSYTCGTAKVIWSGCCVGIHTPKSKIMLTRSASVVCFLNLLKKDGLIEFKGEGKELFKEM